MREPYVEGIASRHGPESWRRAREGSPQALTGEHAGQKIEFGLVPISDSSVQYEVPKVDTTGFTCSTPGR